MLRRKDAFLSGLICFLILLNFSCLRTKIQNVPATSEPTGVNVYVDGKLAGKTPLILNLDKRNGHTVRFEAEGYQPVVIEITSVRPSFTNAILKSMIFVPFGALFGGLIVGYKAEDLMEIYYGFIGGAIITMAGMSYAIYQDSSKLQLYPQTLSIEMKKIEGEASPQVIQLDEEQARQIRWVRVTAR
ncbi:MAG: PEGA domain-containing protein [Candidatus Saccharicenans sp.]